MRSGIFVICALIALTGCAGPDTIAVAVRHAEKEKTGSDPGLTATGQLRAQALRDRLTGARITAVFSTDTRRTRLTAQPLADLLKVPITLYTTTADVRAKVMASHKGETVLIVGHSNTLGSIATAFGAELPSALPQPIADDDYDNMLTILVNAKGGASATHSTYGATSPLTPQP